MNRMDVSLFETETGRLAVIAADRILISEVQDALDLMADLSMQDVSGIILQQECLSPEFYDLSTRLAGDILQKFSTYGMKLGIVGDFSMVQSNSLRDFIRESNRYGHVCFVESTEEAIRKLGN